MAYRVAYVWGRVSERNRLRVETEEEAIHG